MMSQRLYTDRQWVDPVVLELTHVEPALVPPAVATGTASRSADGTRAVLAATLRDLGQARSVDAGFQYRRKKGVEELYTPDDVWTDTPLVSRTSPGPYTTEASGLRPGQEYEFRAMVKHPLLTVFGEEATVPQTRPAP
jgi:alpha-L-fucosidase